MNKIKKCAYCTKEAIGYDALGMPICLDHLDSADGYVANNSTKGSTAMNNGNNRYPLRDQYYEEDRIYGD